MVQNASKKTQSRHFQQRDATSILQTFGIQELLITSPDVHFLCFLWPSGLAVRCRRAEAKKKTLESHPTNINSLSIPKSRSEPLERKNMTFASTLPSIFKVIPESSPWASKTPLHPRTPRSRHRGCAAKILAAPGTCHVGEIQERPLKLGSRIVGRKTNSETKATFTIF